MIDSILYYYDTYSTPITDVQRVALKALIEMTNAYIQHDLDHMTFGEARDTIKYLHDLWKSKQ